MYYADTKVSKAYPPFNIVTSTMPHVVVSGGGWSTLNFGQYVPIAPSPIRKLALVNPQLQAQAGQVSPQFLMQTQDIFSNPSPITAEFTGYGIFTLMSNSPGAVQFASPDATSNWSPAHVAGTAT